MNITEIQESVIALLHGDLRNRASVQNLLENLAKSGEGQDILLKQISMVRKIHALGVAISPSTSVDSRILETVAGLELSEHTPVTEDSSQSTSRSFFSFWVVISLLCSFLAGISISRFLSVGSQVGLRATSKNGDSVATFPINTGPWNNMRESVRNSRQEKYKDQAIQYLHGVKADKQVDHEYGKRENSEGVLFDYPQINSLSNSRLHLTAPNGGENWHPGSIVPIRWQGGSELISVAIQFSSDEGKTWNTIGKNIAGQELLWKVPNIPSGDRYLMKVSEENVSGILPSVLPPLLHDTALNIADFNSDCSLLAVPDYGGAITIWDMSSRKILHTLVGHTKPVIQVTFSPDDQSLVSTSLDGTVRMWDVSTGTEKHRVAGKGNVLQVSWTASYHPDGHTIALGNDDGTITLWDAASGAEISTFSAHTQAIRCLEYTGAGNRLLTTSTDGQAGIFDPLSGSAVQLFTSHDGVVNGIVMTQDESQVITSGFDGLVKFWDVKTGRLIRAIQYFDGRKIGKIILSSDENMLVVAGFGKDIILANPMSGEMLATLPVSVSDDSIGAWPVFSSDSKILAVAHEHNILLWSFTRNSDVSDGTWTVE